MPLHCVLRNMRALVCIIGVSSLCASKASAQTLAAFKPMIVCPEEIGEVLKAQGGCEAGQNLHDAIIGHAESSASLWGEFYKKNAKILTSRAGKSDIIAPVTTDGVDISPAMSRRLIRAETPVFTDPETGLILFVNPQEYPGDKRLYSERMEIGFERAVGVSLLTAYPNIQKAFSDTKPAHIVAAGESLANALSAGAHANEPLPGVGLKRNFTRPLFETQGEKGNWDAGLFWSEAFIATNRLRDEKLPLPAFLNALFETLNIVSAPPSREATFYDGLDTAFQGFGWDRFPADGFGTAYAASMAAHHINAKSFASPEHKITLKAEEITAKEFGESHVNPFATEFTQLDIAGALLRETELNLSVCEIVGEKCIASDDIRLLFEGHVVDDRSKETTFMTRRGDPVKIIDGNEVRLTLPGRREAFDLNDKQFFSLKIGVANTTFDETIKYRLNVQLAVREATCTWEALAETLNPWWRGDLDSPNALIPNNPDIPAHFKAELSHELRQGWYMSEKAYRDDIGYDGEVFDKYLTEAKLRSLAGDAYDVIVPLDYQRARSKDENDRSFRQLMPSAAGVDISGALNESGTVCVSPISIMEMPDFSNVQNASEADILAQMGLPPELADIGNMSDGEEVDEAKLAMIMAALLQADTEESERMENDARDVMLQIYSPNLFTQQLGMLFPGQSLPLVHAGRGGWTPNAGFNIYVRLPGTAALDLEPGEYEAQGLIIPDFALSKDDQDGKISPVPPFYVWGERAGDKINWRNYTAPHLSGTLVIKKQVSGAAIASLSLTGQAYEQDSQHRCNRENEDGSPLPAECRKPDAGFVSKGKVKIAIDRMFLLGVSEGEPLPVQNMFNLTSARIPNPNTRSFE